MLNTMKLFGSQSIKDILEKVKNNRYEKTKIWEEIIVSIFEWGVLYKEGRDKADKKLFLSFFNACEANKDLVIVDDFNGRMLLRSLLFSLSKTLKFPSSIFIGKNKIALEDYLGDSYLLKPLGDNKYDLNVNRFIYSVWEGLDIEEDDALTDVFRLLVSIIPTDSRVFGYSKLNCDVKGDGIIERYSVILSFDDVQPDVNVEFLEKSLTYLVKSIKNEFNNIEGYSGDIGWVDVVAKFYEKCHDPIFLTKKIGLKASSLYQFEKQKSIKD